MRKIDLLSAGALLAGAAILAQPALAAGERDAAGQTPAQAQPADDGTTIYGQDRQPGTQSGTSTMLGGDDSDEVADARELLAEAAKVVARLKADPDAAGLLERARGIYVVPDYAKGALIAGAHGGEGVMLAKQGDGSWSAPVFYEMGAVSIGAQAGFTAGSIAMILMDRKAVDSFRQENNWSLDADADLTIVDYSAMAKAAGGKGDIALWSDTEGAFAGADISVSDIAYDDEETQAYYGKEVSPADILGGAGDAEQRRSAVSDALSG